MTTQPPDSGHAKSPRGATAPMDASSLDGLPGDARIWIFPSDREMQGRAAEALLRTLDGFLDGWNAHGAPLRSGRALLYERFLVVGVDEAATPPSGCSIDALFRDIQSLAAAAGARFLGAEAVWYRDAQGQIKRTTRPAFRAEANSGRITADSIVFDNTVARLSDLRTGRWEGPASERWHAALLPQAARTA